MWHLAKTIFYLFMGLTLLFDKDSSIFYHIKRQCHQKCVQDGRHTGSGFRSFPDSLAEAQFLEVNFRSETRE
jgi:hypothetical protein